LYAAIAYKLSHLSKAGVARHIKKLGNKIRLGNQRLKKRTITASKLRSYVKSLIRNMMGYIPSRRVNCITKVVQVAKGLAKVRKTNVVQSCRAIRFNPVGVHFKTERHARSVVFRNLPQHETVIVISYKPGFLLDFQQLATKAANSVVTTRSVTPPQLPFGKFLTTLKWGAQPEDLDLIIITPPKKGDKYGDKVFWGATGSKTKFPFSKLDIDDMDGYGPETITSHKSVVGEYSVYVHCFSCYDDKASLKTFQKSKAQVTVFGSRGLIKELHIGDAKLDKGKLQKYWHIGSAKCRKITTRRHGKKVVCKMKFINQFMSKQPKFKGQSDWGNMQRL